MKEANEKESNKGHWLALVCRNSPDGQMPAIIFVAFLRPAERGWRGESSVPSMRKERRLADAKGRIMFARFPDHGIVFIPAPSTQSTFGT